MTRTTRVLGGVLAALVLALGYAADAEGIAPTPLLRPGHEPLAITADGVVWFDEGTVLLSGLSSGSMTPLGKASGQLAASASAVAIMDGEWLGSVLPARLSRIAEPLSSEVPGGGCVGWLPNDYPDEGTNFAVVGDELVSAGVCERFPDGGNSEAATRQPLFVHGLRGGGRWRVLRWLEGGKRPTLTGEGNVLAVGTQVTSTLMRVALIELPSGRTKARFDMPNGYLAFAASNRLLLSALVRPQAKHEVFPLSSSYDLRLYTTDGRRLAALGTASEVPLVSNMHLLEEHAERAAGAATLVVRSLLNGESRPVVGFNLARRLRGFAFHWPALTVVQTKSTPLSQSEGRCWGPEYGPESIPRMETIDLARKQPFDAPPAPVHLTPLPDSCEGPAPP